MMRVILLVAFAIAIFKEFSSSAKNVVTNAKEDKVIREVVSK